MSGRPRSQRLVTGARTDTVLPGSSSELTLLEPAAPLPTVAARPGSMAMSGQAEMR
jgi:hypothetical protein